MSLRNYLVAKGGCIRCMMPSATLTLSAKSSKNLMAISTKSDTPAISVQIFLCFCGIDSSKLDTCYVGSKSRAWCLYSFREI